MTLLGRLLDKAVDCPRMYLVQREGRNYEAFLNLYQRVGYAPGLAEQLQLWKDRSVNTWCQLDSALPGTYTGGQSGDQLASGRRYATHVAIDNLRSFLVHGKDA